ncbi:hypothetical protein B0J17DRAFT_674281 [Rhizoctonia solani]|nr:hypothetical protein B0J17DRAFT_674281 [Rhizoctonia solani]
MAFGNVGVAATTTGADNNCNPHPPELDQGLDVFAVTSLKDFKDKEILLQNIGHLHGIRVDSNDGPQSLSRRAAKTVGNNPPFIQEMNEYLTETISTQTERETNYIHHGWSIDATSTTNPWISSRITSRNQRNGDGVWLTRRTLVQQFCLRVSMEDLVAAPDFEAEIKAAVQKPSVFQRFEATYRALHKWGDVVPLVRLTTINCSILLVMSYLHRKLGWALPWYLQTLRPICHNYLIQPHGMKLTT